MCAAVGITVRTFVEKLRETHISKKPLLDGVPQVLNTGYVRELFVKSVA